VQSAIQRIGYCSYSNRTVPSNIFLINASEARVYAVVLWVERPMPGDEGMSLLLIRSSLRALRLLQAVHHPLRLSRDLLRRPIILANTKQYTSLTAKFFASHLTSGQICRMACLRGAQNLCSAIAHRDNLSFLICQALLYVTRIAVSYLYRRLHLHFEGANGVVVATRESSCQLREQSPALG
jgi:hypothetical protein